MHEVVKKYLEEKRKQERDEYKKRKEKKLIELGIFEKEFPADPENFDYSEYDEGFYEANTNFYRRYKKIPIEVSDEDFEEILKYSKEEKKSNMNGVSIALKIFAGSEFVGGFILGCINAYVETGYYYSRTEFSFGIAMVYWLISLFSGICMLGFAKIIDLLQDIVDNK